MTEEEAQSWIRTNFGVSREIALAQFAELVRQEAPRQNLISAATIDAIWGRHLVDSAQLMPLVESAGAGEWVDIGTGAGFPGMVAALLCERAVTLIEPRARRVEFLQQSAEALGISDRVTVHLGKVETYRSGKKAAVISARAVAALPALLAGAFHLSTGSTVWVLPKGQNAQSEVDAARKAWQGSFHVKQSITQAESGIVVATEVSPR